MHKSALAFAAVAFVALTGCSVATEAESPATDETSAALTPIGGITLPPVTTRRLVRKDSAGCSTVYGDGGKWTGDVVAGPYQSSGVFCAYSWSTATKADPDLAKLDEIAKYDTYLARPFNVPDPRPSNEDLEKVTMTKYSPLTSGLPISNGGDPTPRSSGCDVCVFADQTYLWVVLPPEAYDQSFYLRVETDAGMFSLGPVSEVAFFSNTITGFGGSPVLRWGKE